MGPGQQGQADGVGILLDGGLGDLLRRLVQPGVDDLEAGVAQGPGDDLGPAVMAIEPGLGHHDSIATMHARNTTQVPNTAQTGDR